MARRGSKVDVVALVPDREAIRAWFDDTDPADREATIAAAREKFWDLCELCSVQRQVTGVIALVNDCPALADAYSHLAELRPAQAGALHELALEAASLSLGSGFEKRYEGLFWADHDTRPYVRALYGIAGAALERGDRPAAEAYWIRLLKLCPNDNLGVRYLLVNELLKRGAHDEAGRLCRSYPDDSGVDLAYAAALTAFHAGGDCAAAKQAFAANRYVPELLASTDAVRSSAAAFETLGSLAQAVRYVEDMGEVWRKTEAVEWLGACVQEWARDVYFTAARRVIRLADGSAKPVGRQPGSMRRSGASWPTAVPKTCSRMSFPETTRRTWRNGTFRERGFEWRVAGPGRSRSTCVT